MGLSSVSHVALSGMTAATTVLGVAANNLANSQTPGFKASSVQLATQAYQTLSPGGVNVNPQQVGLGVVAAAITPDFSQGTIAQKTGELNDELPLLALEGEGLFILEGDDGERLYTRNGQFRLNDQNELTNAQGYRVLGHVANEYGQLDESQLAPIKIRIGQYAPGEENEATRLEGYMIGSDGRVVGKYSDGSKRVLAQMRLARFPNYSGLYQQANTLYAATPAAGNPLETNPGAAGAGRIISGATELSNVDVGKQLLDISQAKTQFLANLFVAHTSFSLLDELLRLGHRR